MGQGVGNSAAIADDKQALMPGFQMLVHLYFHVVEFDLHTVQKRIVVCRSGGNLVQSVNHLNDAIQNPFGQNQAQIAGGGIQRRGDEGFLDSIGGGAATPNEIAKPLDNDPAAQHIAQPGDGLTVAVGVLKGLREVLGYQQGKIGIFRLSGRIFVAVSIHSDNAIGILVDDSPLGVHAEGSHPVAVLLGAVDDFALIKLVSQVREYLSRQLHPDANIHPVGFCGDVQVAADRFHPFAAAASNGNNTVLTAIGGILTQNFITILCNSNRQHRCIKEKLYFILEIIIKIFQNHIVDICT